MGKPKASRRLLAAALALLIALGTTGVPVSAGDALTDWTQVQGAIDTADNGGVIDLSGFDAGPGSAMTFTVGEGKNLTLRGESGCNLRKRGLCFRGKQQRLD